MPGFLVADINRALIEVHLWLVMCVDKALAVSGRSAGALM